VPCTSSSSSSPGSRAALPYQATPVGWCRRTPGRPGNWHGIACALAPSRDTPCAKAEFGGIRTLCSPTPTGTPHLAPCPTLLPLRSPAIMHTDTRGTRNSCEPDFVTGATPGQAPGRCRPASTRARGEKPKPAVAVRELIQAQRCGRAPPVHSREASGQTAAHCDGAAGPRRCAHKQRCPQQQHRHCVRRRVATRNASDG
jgi:hypothetical protein